MPLLNKLSNREVCLKIRIEKQFEANEHYSYILDFKADESILKTNVEDYIILKPVVTSVLEK